VAIVDEHHLTIRIQRRGDGRPAVTKRFALPDQCGQWERSSADVGHAAFYRLSANSLASSATGTPRPAGSTPTTCAATSRHCRDAQRQRLPHQSHRGADRHGRLRRHQGCKQAESWRLEQPEPGVLIWHTPSGRTYTTTPTRYTG